MIPNPFPLDVTLKVNSPQLLAFLAQFGEAKFASAEDFNKIFQALNYLYVNLGSGAGSSLFLGDYVSLEALQTAHPNPTAGNTANIIVEGAPNDLAVWDNDDSSWIVYPGSGYNFITPSFQETTDIDPNTTNTINVGGLTITNKINFITSLITQIRNVRLQDKDGDIALTSDVATLSQNIAAKQPVELLLTDADVIKSGGLPRIAGLNIQGHTLVQGSRVLVTGPSFSAWNGFFRVSTGPDQFGQYILNRTSDALTTASLNNALVSVTNGTFAGKSYIQKTPNPIVNSTAIVFEEFGGASANATDLIAGIVKLYNALGSQIDGAITPKAVNEALNSKVKVVNQLTDIVTSSVTLQNTDMNFDVDANSVYVIEGYLYGGGNAGGGARINLLLPSGCNGFHSVLAASVNTFTNSPASVTTINSNISAFASSSNNQQTRYIATLVTGSNGGNVIFQFATGTGGQSATFRSFSHLKITKK